VKLKHPYFIGTQAFEAHPIGLEMDSSEIFSCGNYAGAVGLAKIKNILIKFVFAY